MSVVGSKPENQSGAVPHAPCSCRQGPLSRAKEQNRRVPEPSFVTRSCRRGRPKELVCSIALRIRRLFASARDRFLSDKEDPRILATGAMARPLDDREACLRDICLEHCSVED